MSNYEIARHSIVSTVRNHAGECSFWRLNWSEVQSDSDKCRDSKMSTAPNFTLNTPCKHEVRSILNCHFSSMLPVFYSNVCITTIWQSYWELMTLDFTRRVTITPSWRLFDRRSWSRCHLSGMHEERPGVFVERSFETLESMRVRVRLRKGGQVTTIWCWISREK